MTLSSHEIPAAVSSTQSSWNRSPRTKTGLSISALLVTNTIGAIDILKQHCRPPRPSKANKREATKTTALSIAVPEQYYTL